MAKAKPAPEAETPKKTRNRRALPDGVHCRLRGPGFELEVPNGVLHLLPPAADRKERKEQLAKLLQDHIDDLAKLGDTKAAEAAKEAKVAEARELLGALAANGVDVSGLVDETTTAKAA